MRIGFDAKRLYNNFTGLGNYSRTLVSNLQIYYPDNAYFLYTPRIKRHARTDMFLNGPAFKTKVPARGNKAIWRTWKLSRDLRKDQIDIYHGLSHEIPRGLRKTKIKSVVTIHDLVYKVYPKTFPWADRQIYDWKFRYACKHADKVVAISKSTKSDIVTHFGIDPDRVEVVYQPCHSIYYEETHQDNPASVLEKYGIPEDFLIFVGSVIPRKNLENTLRALSIMSGSVQVPCVVVGRGGKYKTRMQELAKDLGLSKHIIWVDGVDNLSDLRALYTKALLSLYPSFYEGFGLPVAESLLCRTPVVTSDRSSLPEAGGPGAICVNPEDPTAIARAIEHLLIDTMDRNRLGESGRIYAMELFDPKRTTDQYMRLYQSVKDSS